MKKLTQTILRNLVFEEVYARNVLPYIKDVYFDNPVDRTVFDLINEYILKYNRLPTKATLEVEVETKKGLGETVAAEAKKFIIALEPDEHQDLAWLTDITEQWCKKRALHNALMEANGIIQSGKEEVGSIVKILEDAIAVSFDTHVGHDYLDDANVRYDYYHNVVRKIPFDIEILNRITQGGLPDKSLTVVMGGVGVGKTACMCHFAASNMFQGKNVLYITLEMAEERIAERIDANLLDCPINDLMLLSKERYDRRITALREKTPGKLIIKEYPTGAGSTNDFRHVLHELKYKKKFRPDIVYIDYLNICSSSRVKFTANIGMYSYVKSVAEEIRGLAVEYNIPIITATQLNRDGFESSDPGMEHIAESWGLPATADFIFVITVTKELLDLNQMQGKQIKNRFGDLSKNNKFLIGRDLSKMRLFDIDRSTDLYH